MPLPSRSARIALTILSLGACSPGDAVAPSHSEIPAAISVVEGNNQSAVGGASLALPIAFKLVDSGGNGIAGRAVTFSVTTGEGMLADTMAAVMTNSTGVANAPAWTLGKLAVPQQMTATAGAISGAANATVTTQFHAEVRFFGAPVDATYLAAFTRAVNRLNAEVVGQVTPVGFANQDLATCGITGVPALNEQVPSLLIYVSVGSIDGPGGIIASSGPCYVRQSNNLTVVGTMLFDAVDLPTIYANGQLNDVVFHEIQHVLGFGTLWSTATPPLIVNAGTAQTAFTGARGIAGCEQAGGVASDCLPSIPLESSGGSGAADGHWRWSIFGNELMTALLPEPGTPKLLSAMTIGSISDLGYQTNPNVADPYLIPSALAASYRGLSTLPQSRLSDMHDVLLKARARVTPDGKASTLP